MAWEESKHPREGGKFAPSGGGGGDKPAAKRSAAANIAIGAGKIIAAKGASDVATGALAQAAKGVLRFIVKHREGIHSAISAVRAGGKVATVAGAAETATGAGAVVGIPTLIAGMAANAIAGHYIDKAVDDGIDALSKRLGLSEKRNAPSNKGVTHKTLQYIIKHARR